MAPNRRTIFLLVTPRQWPEAGNSVTTGLVNRFTNPAEFPYFVDVTAATTAATSAVRGATTWSMMPYPFASSADM